MRGSGGNAPRSWSFFSVCHHKKQHSGAWKSDICKSASFMFIPDIYLVILKIALKMSFWCSKNKILAKVPNHLTATVSWDTFVKKKKKKKNIYIYIYIYIYSGTAAKYILVQVQHTFQPISNNQKKVTLCQSWEEQSFSDPEKCLKKKKKKKKEISRGVRRHVPPENSESWD